MRLITIPMEKEYCPSLPEIAVVRTGNLGESGGFPPLCADDLLENLNTFAISGEGELTVNVIGGQLRLSGEIIGQESMLHRQAIIRQIERWAVMQENSLLGETDYDSEKRILDVGSGTLIAAVMMRGRFPNAQITGVEPGLITPKTEAIAKKKDIELIRGGIEKVPADRKYDYVMLHFVLEHSVKQAKDLVRESLRRLDKGGEISIAAPNFDAFHREVEAAIGMNQRDPETRLSCHDLSIGHQIIFTKGALIRLIEETMEEEWISLPIHARTILPRPLAFDTLCALNHHTVLLELAEAGNMPGMEDRGSVLCITVGDEAEVGQRLSTGDGGKTRTIFKQLTAQFLGSPPDVIGQSTREALIKFLNGRYPDLLPA